MKIQKNIFSLLILIFCSINASAQTIPQIPVSIRLQVSGKNYTGKAKAKAWIHDGSGNVLWSNDGRITPSKSFEVDVRRGLALIRLGETNALPDNLFDGTADRFIALNINAGFGYRRFRSIPFLAVPRAVNAYRLGGRPASEYLTADNFSGAFNSITITPSQVSGLIPAISLAPFSNNSNTLSIGDGTNSLSKVIQVLTGSQNSPALRYNATTSSWEWSNGGIVYNPFGQADSLIGSGSVTTAVDLDTNETNGVLPISKGGSGASTAALARLNLGLEIGTNIQAFVKHNTTAVVAPTAANDSSQGYSAGSYWIDTTASEIYQAISVSSGLAVWKAITKVGTNQIENGSVTNSKIASGAVDSTSILDNAIVNADISSTAAISLSKLQTATSAQIPVANGSGVLTPVNITGDIALTSSGVASLQTDSVDGTNISVSGEAIGSLLIYNGTDWITYNPGISGYVLKSQGPGFLPTWGSVSAGSLAAGSVTTTEILDGTVANVDLATNSIVSSNIQDGTVALADLASDSVDTSKIVNGSIVTADLSSGSVDTVAILNSTIVNADISATAAIDLSKLQSVTSAQVPVGNGSGVLTSVTISGDISLSNAGVTSIQSNSVDGTNISIGGETLGDLLIYNGTDWVNFNPGTSGYVLTSQGAGVSPTWGLIGSSSLSAGSVTTTEILNGTIASADIGTGAVTSTGILDGTITSTDFSTGAVNSTAILDNTITSSDIATGAITSTGILNGTIGTVDYAAGSVDSAAIANSTIVNADVSASAGINLSKLETVSSAQVPVANVSGVLTATTLSGDVTISNTGVTTVQDNSVDGTDISLSGETTGDVPYFNGTDWTRLAATTSGNVLTSQGVGVAPAWAASGVGNTMPHSIYSRQFAFIQPISTAATAFTTYGTTNVTTTGTGSAQPALTNRMYLGWATAAALNSIAGITGPFTVTRPNYGSKLSTRIRTDATIATRRIWAGLVESAPSALTTSTTGAVASAIDFAAIAYDTGGTGNITDWLCCTGDGTNFSCTTTGVAVAASTEYVITVDWTSASSVVCRVNNTSITKNTNVSIGAVNIGPYVSTITRVAAAQNVFISGLVLEQN